MSRIALWIGILIAAIASAAETKTVTLTAGRGELLQFEHDIIKVVIAEPKIADAVVVSPRDVMVNAKGAGKTTLVIWETGSTPMRYDVNVNPDTTETENFRRAIEGELRALPDAKISFTGNAESIVLTGTAPSSDISKRAEALAATHSKKVTNLVSLPAAHDPRQILLQVKFASIDRTMLQELGFNFFSANGKTLGSTGTQQFQSPRFTQLQLQGGDLNNTSVNFADLLNLFVFRPDLNIGATIRAMQQQDLLQILAEPNLIVIEGSEASFLAGGEFPFPTLTSSSTGGAISPVVTVQFKKFGIQLGFTPTIMPSGAIRLQVKPEVSALDFANAVTLQGFQIPAISTRRAETEVVLRDGESFAIAGLIDNRVVQTLSRVRGLGDVPILGYFFRSRSTKRSTDELLVVVTPRFVKPIPADEKAKLPDMVETFLPTVAEQKALKDAKQKKGKKKPFFVGKRGHDESTAPPPKEAKPEPKP